jgi:hypothetical protein
MEQSYPVQVRARLDEPLSRWLDEVANPDGDRARAREGLRVP